ncbi:ATP-binding protein [Mesorhizobium sp. ORM6]
MSDIDPDAVGILCRNLVENAMRYGSDSSPVEVTLDPDGLLTVSNDGPIVSPETLARLANRFERGGTSARGSGIGLSIVSTIADRIGSRLTLRSPRPGMQSGFEASVSLAVASESKSTASS